MKWFGRKKRKREARALYEMEVAAWTERCRVNGNSARKSIDAAYMRCLADPSMVTVNEICQVYCDSRLVDNPPPVWEG